MLERATPERCPHSWRGHTDMDADGLSLTAPLRISEAIEESTPGPEITQNHVACSWISPDSHEGPADFADIGGSRTSEISTHGRLLRTCTIP